MIAEVSGVFLGLFGLVYTSYITWHAGDNIWGLDTIGDYTARLLYPGESDIRHAYDRYRAQQTTPGTFSVNEPPCNLCGDDSVTVGNGIAPNEPLTWKGKDGKDCSDIGGVSESWALRLNPLGALYAAQWDSTCGKYRPENQPAQTSLLTDKCTAVAGMNGIPDRRLFWSPRDYIAMRLFGRTVAQLYPLSDKLLTSYNKTTFTRGNPYQNMRVSEICTATNNDNVSSFAWDCYYQPQYRDDLMLDSGKKIFFLPPQLITYNTDRLERFGDDYANSSQWLLVGKPHTGTMRGSFSSRTNLQYADTLASFCQRNKFLAWYGGYTADGLLVTACEWTPDLGNPVPASPGVPQGATVRGLKDWTPAECREYINKYMQYTACMYKLSDFTGCVSGGVARA
jgi:hypothetical protein